MSNAALKLSYSKLTVICGGNTTNHALFIVHIVSNDTAYPYENLYHSNLPQEGFELRSLRLQAGVLPIEPPLHKKKKV